MRFFSFLSRFASAWRDYPAEENAVLGNRYIVKQLLGEGSYGITYKCLDRENGTHVALKQSRPSKGKLARHLLNREASILKKLSHPQIPQHLDFFDEGKHTYLAMSYLEGDTLEDLIFEKDEKFDEQACIRMTLKLLELVTYIHEKGFVHLDLRIPNVLFQGEDMYLIDFGLAREIGEEPPVQLNKRQKTRMRPSSSFSSRPFKDAEVQADLIDVGHFMLFMLYSDYEPLGSSSAAERSWQEELELSSDLRDMIERLLELQEPYTDTQDVVFDLQALYKQNPSDEG
ncbi:protein kinase family protein [Neobacillus mesonae]|nr:protein kinase family protein [Neobacillus mesonae]